VRLSRLNGADFQPRRVARFKYRLSQAAEGESSLSGELGEALRDPRLELV
jgi:hypothetical protein